MTWSLQGLYSRFLMRAHEDSDYAKGSIYFPSTPGK